MARIADVVVVGGGIIGCGVARELARRGAAVRLFERHTIGGGATHASAGILAPYIEGHAGSPLLALGVRSLAMYDDFVAAATEESGIDVEYRRCGTLEIADGDAAAERLRSRVADSAPSAQWLDAAAVRAVEPALAESVHGGLLIPAHGYAAAGTLTEALAWSAMRHGAQVEAGHEVAAIRAVGDGVTVVTADGSEWTAADVVICAGTWLHTLNVVPPASARKVHPIRGQLLRLSWQGAPLGHVIWGPDCYVVPWQSQLVLVGATVEDVGFDARPTAAGVRDLLDGVCDLLPEAWRATFLEARAGLRPATGDGLPIIGRSPAARHVTYAAGHYRNGILLAPLTAKAVADLVLDDTADPSLDLLRP